MPRLIPRSTLLALFPLFSSLRAAPQSYSFPGFVNDPTPPVRGPTSLQGPDPPANPTNDAIVPSSAYTLAAGQTAAASVGVPLDFSDTDFPQPIRGDYGTTDPGPASYEYERLNPDLLAPPGSDSGSIPNGHWPMGLSHNRIQPDHAGWARQQNTQQLPVAKEMAGVDMRLGPGAYRELHWHSANEWSLVLNGSVRIQAMNEDGATFVDDLVAGDVWFFPAGVPHSLQGLENGTEFLLVFDQGDFNDGGTNLITEMFLRTPKESLSKNLNAPLSAFSKLPSDELYIFNGRQAPRDIQQQNTTGPGGALTGAAGYSYHFSQQEPFETPGGSIKILDPSTFPIASMFSTAVVTIKPGAMREIHWHLNSDEWDFILSGDGRLSVYVAPDSGATYDFTAGDVGYITSPASHFLENTGTEDLVYLEVLQAPKYTDISLGQWLALTPRQIIEDTLQLPSSVLDAQSQEKQYVIQGNPNLTALVSGSGTA
ncbi:MAG: hypothetical protein Q9227_000825 [Pyrenula ochraceoflavens]